MTVCGDVIDIKEFLQFSYMRRVGRGYTDDESWVGSNSVIKFHYLVERFEGLFLLQQRILVGSEMISFVSCT